MFIKTKHRLFLWQPILLSGLLVLILASHQTTTAVPNTPEDDPIWEAAAPLSAAGQDARRPRIASSPDGSHSLVVYINEIDDDPYYTMSTNQGQSWSPPSGTKLHATAGTSAQVIGVIDRNDKAFAIWVEKNVALGNELVFSTKTGGGSWTVPAKVDPARVTNAEILDPGVFLDETNNIHLVWVQEEVTYYAYLNNGTTSWSKPVIVEEEPRGFSGEPNVVVDRIGRLYLTWQNDTATGGLEVVFSRGTITGTPTAPIWNPEVENLIISPPSNIEPLVSHAVLGLSGNRLSIAYTRKIDIVDPMKNDQQDIFYTTCSVPCNSLNSDDFKLISGQRVEVNGIDPSEVVPALALDNLRGAAYITFSGVLPTTTNPNEIILSMQSCDFWGTESNPFQVENDSNYRFVKPSMVISDRWLELAYERISSDNSHMIFHRRAEVSCPAYVMVPFLMKN